MSDEINFCPFCDAPQHKLTLITETMMFCKECNKFFTLEELKLKCPKCDSKNIENSDFPSPDGEIVFQCKSCKKMYPASEFLKKNDIK